MCAHLHTSGVTPHPPSGAVRYFSTSSKLLLHLLRTCAIKMVHNNSNKRVKYTKNNGTKIKVYRALLFEFSAGNGAGV